MSQLPAAAGYTGVKPYRPTDTGRTLMANSQNQKMLDGFWALAEEDSSQGYHAKAVKKAVNELRGCTAPVNSYMKSGSPNRRCIAFSGFEIEYELGNYYGGPQTDVIIIDIRCTRQKAKDEESAALWKIGYSTNSHRWLKPRKPTPSLKPTGKISGNKSKPFKVGINGYAYGLDHAANMLPDHISRGSKDKLTELEASGYHLLFVPQPGNGFKSGWEFVRDLGKLSQNDAQAARILADQMLSAHNEGFHLELTSHRGGSKVLTEAMNLLKRANINLDGKQSIFLSDHTSSQYEADIVRRAIGMDTSDQKWHNATPGIAQLVGGKDFGSADAICSLNELINHSTPDDRKNKFVDTAFTTFKAGTGAWKSGAAIATLAAKFGLTIGFAAAACKVLGSVAISSIPKMNESYHSNTEDKIKKLLKSSTKSKP